MEENQEITIEEHNNHSETMDRLCDTNDFDNIVSHCEMLEKCFHPSRIITANIFYNIASGYSHVSSRSTTTFGCKTSGLATLNFRKALREVSFVEKERYDLNRYTQKDLVLFDDLRSRIYVNFANELKCQGRYFEAIPFYDMADKLGNVYAVFGKGRCLYELAESVYDGGHAFHLYRESSKYYKEALERISEYHPVHQQGIRSSDFYQHFINWFNDQEELYGGNHPKLDSLSGSVHDSRKQAEYFSWCRANRLFLNELNSISTSPVVDHDIVGLPSIVMSINTALTTSESLGFHGHFDEMKNDYCYARYLAFMGVTIPQDTEHFFNATFDQIDTLDYSINNLKTNHLKTCFRVTYSLFDKVAFLLHRFFSIEQVKNDHTIDFKKVWLKNRKQEFRDFFKNSDNTYFKALYFLSREIRQYEKGVEDDTDPSYWFDPDTDRLYKIRNAIEHRSFRLVDGFCFQLTNSTMHSSAVVTLQNEITEKEEELKSLVRQKRKACCDDVADSEVSKLRTRISRLQGNLEEKERMATYHLVIGVDEFERLCMKLLALAKDALIYLSLSIHHEEKKRPDSNLVIPRHVPKK